MRFLTLAAAAAALMIPVSGALAQAPKSVSRVDFQKNLDTHFNAADANHDGSVSKAELTSELQREIGQAKTQLTAKLRQQFQKLDTNHDGQLSFAEFSTVLANIRPTQTPDQKLQQLDTNHDGKVSLSEWRAPDLARFNKIDTNHDGVITQAEVQAAAGRK
jgi:Ca2+-binding EF-hand superfamily protein